MATAGPLYPSTTVSDGSGSVPIDWITPNNAQASDNNRTTCTLAGTGGTTAGQNDFLNCTGFSFSIPETDTILGIQVDVEKLRNGGSTGQILDDTVELLKAGARSGNNKASASNWPTTEAYTTYGGASDLWGTTWAPSDINASNFGISIRVVGSTAGTNRVANIDHVRITVTHFNGFIVTQSVSSGATQGGATNAWTNPGNITASDNTYTTQAPSGTAALNDFIAATNGGFSIPDNATITGVEALIEWKQTSSGTTTNAWDTVQLTKDGSSNVGTNKASTANAMTNVLVPTTDTVYTIGGGTDLWGATLTPAEVNASTFGVRIRFGGTWWETETCTVDHIQLRVYYTLPPAANCSVKNSLMMMGAGI